MMEIKATALIVVIVAYVFINAFVMTIIEPQTYPDLMTGIWWVMTTITTIGYGDVYPTTTFAQIYAIIFVDIVGIGLFGFFIGKIVDVITSYYRRKKEGKSMYLGKKHYVVVGWTSTSKLSIQNLLKETKNEIVLIGHLDTTPIQDEDRVHYIKGSPTDFVILEKANIQEAQAILIFSPDNVEQTDLADGYTLLVATSIERYDAMFEQNIHTVVEIKSNKHKENFSYVKVDEFVLSRESVANLMVETAII